MKELLIEIGTEEVPARFIDHSIEYTRLAVLDFFKKNGIEASKLKVYATPRRLVVFVKAVAEMTKTKVIEKKGPALDNAFDKQGNPTRAAFGFASSLGLDIKELTTKKIKGKEYIFGILKKEGEDTVRKIEEFLVEFLRKIDYAKKMKWGSLNFNYVRPIRWLFVKFGKRTLKIEIAGIKSNSKSYGHKFLSPNTFETEINDYFFELEKRNVIISSDKRREMLLNQFSKIENEHHLKIESDEELLNEVVNLTEYPWAILCNFNKKYLELPDIVIKTSMKKHQKCFAVYKEDKLTNKFIAISNVKPNNMIKKGQERVIAARLEDALFFFAEDKKKPLSVRISELKGLIYINKLGTMYDKKERLKKIAQNLLSFIDEKPDKVIRAAELCKTDLLTSMVIEFPVLQGEIGRIYALLQGEKQDVADAILEHYMPRNSLDSLPRTMTGAILSLSEKLDNLCNCFILGLQPSGAKDPYKLRRQSLGIIKILINSRLDIDIIKAIKTTIDIIKNANPLLSVKEELLESIIDFIRNRFRTILEEENIRYDIIDAVLYADFSNVLATLLCARSLQEYRDKEKSFEDILVLFKRMNNIIGKKEYSFNEAYLKEEAEKALYKFHRDRLPEIFSLIENRKYIKLFSALLDYSYPVNRFFDDVLVNCEDPILSENRKALIQSIITTFSRIIDFSKIKLD